MKREQLVLHKFGKILKQRKPVVIEAIRNSGVKIRKGAKPKEILSKIKQNRDNRTLQKNIGLMIFFDQFLNNAQRGYIPKKYRDKIRIRRPKGGKTLYKYDDFLGKKEGGSSVGNFFRSVGDKLKGDPNKVKGQGWDKFKSVFQKDPNKERKAFGDTKFGSFWNDTFKKGEDGSKSKFGQFASDNSDSIFNIGATFLTGIFNKKGEEEVQESYETTPKEDGTGNQGGGGGNKPAIPMPLIIGGGLAIIVALVLIVKGSGGGSQATTPTK